jgi:hypothetical protein
MKLRTFKILTGVSSDIIPEFANVISELDKEPLSLLVIDLLQNISTVLKPYISEHSEKLSLAMVRSQPNLAINTQLIASTAASQASSTPLPKEDNQPAAAPRSPRQ